MKEHRHGPPVMLELGQVHETGCHDPEEKYGAHVTCYVFDPVADVEAFHRKFGLEYTGKPRALPFDMAEFRRKFLGEEGKEYSTATHRLSYWLAMLEGFQRQMFDNDEEYNAKVVECLNEALDALVDSCYVAIGNAHLHGFDFREAWRRVHEANMKKVRAQSAADSKRGSTYDVIKPPGWEAPDHTDLVKDHAHKEEE